MAHDTLLQERVQAMYAAAAGANTVNFALAVLATVVSVPSAAPEVLGAWAAAVAATLVLRWHWLHRYTRRHLAPAATRAPTATWARRLTLAMGLSGLVWGVGGAVFSTPGQPLLVALWAILVCGIAAGAVHAAAYHLPAQRAYLVPLLLPLIARHAWEAFDGAPGRLEHGGIAVGLVCYLAFCLGQGRRQALLLQDSLAMRHEKDDLLVALGEQTTLAEQARGRAEEAALSKARFFAAASHDLRQPLQALGFFTQALREDPAAPSRQLLVERLDDSVKALDNLFDGILQIARIDAGSLSAPPPVLAPAPLLERITLHMQPLAEARQLRLAFRPSRTDAYVRVHATALERMVGNLLSNAIRYTEQGCVLVLLRVTRDRVRIQVRDSGRGIAPSEHTRIFEEFYQPEDTPRDRAQGVGLGLATVRRLAATAGVGVSLRSCPGHGSTFTLDLPHVSPDAAPPSTTPAPGSADEVLHGVVAWVIDDERDVRDGCAILLRQWGMQVVAAPSLQDIERSPQGLVRPQLVVCDDRLEGQHGMDLVVQLRKQHDAVLPALIVSGSSDMEQQARAAAAGVPWLHKPVKPARLRATLQHLLTKDPTPPSPADLHAGSRP